MATGSEMKQIILSHDNRKIYFFLKYGIAYVENVTRDFSLLPTSDFNARYSSCVLDTASRFSIARRRRYARHSPIPPHVEHL